MIVYGLQYKVMHDEGMFAFRAEILLLDLKHNNGFKTQLVSRKLKETTYILSKRSWKSYLYVKQLNIKSFQHKV